MAPDACAAGTLVLHMGWLHVQDPHAGRTNSYQIVRLLTGSPCKAPTTSFTHEIRPGSVAEYATPRAWSIPLVLLHVKLHVQLTCMSTPRASVDTHLAGQLTPRSEPMQQATSSFSVHWPDFGPSGKFLTGD
ncbi:hypothetical protein IGI04_043128 [Brassica rapa subsp. trilocularis]|uniref:Uncharacterized protein n=1 Tax=Brassica rapa subsp. trilocularis TaxID=1813537 RepID=A0ABQ7KGV4_BRACM|nr:hypothetical protein IGI04_043128 [Brassica rapa subsp. trilocularis]